MTQNLRAKDGQPQPGFVEFVCLISTLMALNSLAIDAMLPALPLIGSTLGVGSPNARQWVITAYLLGFGVSQLVYGPLSDRYGRKPMLIFGLSLYVIFGVLVTLAPTFETMILARLGQGVGASATVLVGAVVRDRYKGEAMARVMSLNYVIFLACPVVAPPLGQAMLLIAPWRSIFGALVVAGLATLAWTEFRMPETLKPADRKPVEVRRVALAYREAFAQRASIGYSLAMTAMFGALFAYINSSQQIFFDSFKAPWLFTPIFALVAAGIGAASLLNAHLVERVGARWISHGAVIAFTLTAAIHAGVALCGYETLQGFVIFQGVTMFFFGLVVGNFGALAMEAMGHIAGTAAAAQGFITNTLGSLVGFAVGQMFDGTVAPLEVGTTVLGVLALVAAIFAEHGRLFRTGDAVAAPAA